MAELRLQTANIRLSAREHKVLTDSFTALVRQESKQQLAELEELYRSRKALREPLRKQLLAAGVDVDRLQAAASKLMEVRDGRAVKEAKRRSVGRRRRIAPRSRGTKAVWGLTSGSETPQYDFNWTFVDVEGSPVSGNVRDTANVFSGELDVYAHTRDSHPRKVDSYAGVGFWYIPNRSGVLNVSVAPPLQELMWTGAGWNDVATAGGWISLGIARYLRDPFRPIDWNVIDTDQLWWNVDNWFDWTDHTRNRSAYSMAVSTIADTSHYYACLAWVRAYAYARDGASVAGSSVQAEVRSFTFSFI